MLAASVGRFEGALQGTVHDSLLSSRSAVQQTTVKPRCEVRTAQMCS